MQTPVGPDTKCPFDSDLGGDNHCFFSGIFLILYSNVALNYSIKRLSKLSHAQMIELYENITGYFCNQI